MTVQGNRHSDTRNDKWPITLPSQHTHSLQNIFSTKKFDKLDFNTRKFQSPWLYPSAQHQAGRLHLVLKNDGNTAAVMFLVFEAGSLQPCLGGKYSISRLN